MVSYSGDDSYEWYGGSVSAKYLVAHRAVDDDWDTDFGWNGNLQFGVSLRDPQVADISGSNGIESDNNNIPNFASPRTSPAFSNMTIIGPMRDTSDFANINPLFRVGAHLRRNTLQSVHNSVIMGWPTGGFLLDAAGVRAAAENDTLQVRNTIIAGVKLPAVRTNVAGFDANAWYTRQAYKNGYTNSINTLGMIDPFNLTNPKFVPGSNQSPLVGNASFTAARLQSPFFTQTNCIGAFAPGLDWTQGWTNFDPQNANYVGTPTATVTSVVFANTATGTNRDSIITVIRNIGGAPIVISNVSLSGSARFTIQNAQTTYNVLPNGSLPLTIRFSPTDTSLQSGVLSFSVGAQNYSINISGRGTLNEPKITIETGNKLDFALVRVNESVQDRVIITNSGTAALNLSDFTISGPDAAAFSIVSGGENLTLAPKAKQIVWIRFSPSEARDYSATLGFTHNAGGSSSVQLVGKGIVVYGQDVLKDSIVGNVTLTNDRIWLLRGFVYVVDGATLNIEPGTVIFGEKSTKGTLIIERGGKINAQGTAELPIVFTSQMPAGQRAPGDWGGIIIAGRAPINLVAGEAQVEGGPRSKYGGNNPEDNSGVLSYVRIEYPGIALAPNNEVNGLTMGAVGSQTKIDHVQVAFSGDDAFEWFGGTVNSTHLIANRAVDDDWDTDFGFNGRVQFAVSQRDPQLADISGSNSFESDNNSIPNTADPRTAPQFSNMTVVGPLAEATTQINPLYRNAAHIRRNSLMSLHNSVILGWPGGILLDQTGVADAAQSGALKIQNNIIAGSTVGKELTTNVTSFDIATWFATASFNNSIVALASGAGVSNAFDLTNPNFLPTANSQLQSGASFTGLTGFMNVNYRGAFGGTRWDSLWANWNSGATVYAALAEYSVAGQQMETVNFNNVQINTTATRMLTVANEGAAPLVVTNAVITGSNTFAMAGQNSFVVVQRGSREIELTFSPTIEGSQTGTLTLTFSDNTTKTINLVGNATGSVKSITIARGVTLKQNRPNPFADRTEIAFDLDDAGFVTLQIVDVTGRIVAELHSGNLPVGPHSFTFSSENLPHGELTQGIYFFNLNVNGTSLTRSMVVAK